MQIIESPHAWRPVVIVNGKVANDEGLRDLLAKAGGDVRPTWGEDSAESLAREAIELGRTGIVVVGGDGTLHGVVAGLAGVANAPPIGLLPWGTGNDFARAAGIPLDDPEAALQIALHGKPHLLDLGFVEGRPFANVMTAGFGAAATNHTDERLKKLLGSFAYLVTGIVEALNLEPVGARIRGPDLAWEGNFVALAVGNGRFAGGGIPVAPQAIADDGLLDVSVLTELPTGTELLVALESLSSGGFPALPDRLLSWRVPALTLETDRAVTVNSDGEPQSGERFDIGCLPRVLPFRLPVASPLATMTES
jgi:lipid kinase YegS